MESSLKTGNPEAAMPRAELINPLEDPRVRANIRLMFDLEDDGKLRFDNRETFSVGTGTDSVRITLDEVMAIPWEALDGIARASRQPGLSDADNGLVPFFRLFAAERPDSTGSLGNRPAA